MRTTLEGVITNALRWGWATPRQILAPIVGDFGPPDCTSIGSVFR